MSAARGANQRGLMSNGFALSIYDLRILGKGIATEADAIGELVRDVDASEVERADFGNVERDGAGATYVGVVHGALVESLREVRAAGESLAARLAAMSRSYESAEEDIQSLVAKTSRLMGLGEPGWQ